MRPATDPMHLDPLQALLDEDEHPQVADAQLRERTSCQAPEPPLGGRSRGTELADDTFAVLLLQPFELSQGARHPKDLPHGVTSCVGGALLGVGHPRAGRASASLSRAGSLTRARFR